MLFLQHMLGFLTWLINLLFSSRFTAVLMVDEVIHSSLDFFFSFSV